ncbi:MAG: hypothetical protein RLO01_05350 [Thalassobaculaceae bacterium]
MYLDPYDAAKEPHSARAEEGRIVETPEPSSWTFGQRLLADWFTAHALDGMVPSDAPIDALGPVIGSVHKLVREPETDDFRYLIYGRTIARKANMGRDGMRVSELIEPTGSVMLEHYRTLAARPLLFVGRLTYVGLDIQNSEWVRAVTPLGRPETGVSHFIVFTDTVQDARPA